jgi:predicted TIM-barrel fold metal-dependent hydrolase
MAHSNPLLLEDVLVRHPKLRLYVMHAGWPMLEEMIGLLYAHPQVYVDIGVIDWYLPKAEFYRYLGRLVEAGFGQRIMFGSDQMVWPEAIAKAAATVELAPFLSAEQRRDIMCRNAMRFLRLDKSVCE